MRTYKYLDKLKFHNKSLQGLVEQLMDDYIDVYVKYREVSDLTLYSGPKEQIVTSVLIASYGRVLIIDNNIHKPISMYQEFRLIPKESSFDHHFKYQNQLLEYNNVYDFLINDITDIQINNNKPSWSATYFSEWAVTMNDFDIQFVPGYVQVKKKKLTNREKFIQLLQLPF